MATRTSHRRGGGETEWHERAACPAHVASSCVCYCRTKGIARIGLGSGTSNGGVIFIIIVSLDTGWFISDHAYGPRVCSETNAVAAIA